MICDCLGFEADPEVDYPEPVCYCGHALDEHDEDGQCLVEEL